MPRSASAQVVERRPRARPRSRARRRAATPPRASSERGQAQLVGDDQHGLGEVQRGVGGVGGDVHPDVALRQLVVAQAARLGAEDEGQAAAARARGRLSRPAAAASRPPGGRGRRCPPRGRARDRLAQGGSRTGPVEHVPGAVGQRPRFGLRRGPRAAPTMARDARGPCSSGRGRRRPRWRRGRAHEHHVDAAEVHGRASLTVYTARECPRRAPRIFLR